MVKRRVWNWRRSAKLADWNLCCFCVSAPAELLPAAAAAGDNVASVNVAGSAEAPAAELFDFSLFK